MIQELIIGSEFSHNFLVLFFRLVLVFAVHLDGETVVLIENKVIEISDKKLLLLRTVLFAYHRV